ncbi:hypothetical protein TRAPUB_3073 [Trametes pubescens]|uniref:Uncharacterized protein n=1 Tax=Trametes pubescens TaxID=154538 RepID=A0A1M2VF16_TRAPU|nr:hypothetical protein TRAPUB_3073 [Trametes pubescens]
MVAQEVVENQYQAEALEEGASACEDPWTHADEACRLEVQKFARARPLHEVVHGE